MLQMGEWLGDFEIVRFPGVAVFLHQAPGTPPPTGGLPRKSWQKDHLRNLSGTDLAYRPPGSTLVNSTDKPKPPYEAWRPG